MLEVQGHIVPMSTADSQQHFIGRVRFDGALVDKVLQGRHAPPAGVDQIDVGEAYVYPGLTDLHSHLGFATLPLWHEPAPHVADHGCTAICGRVRRRTSRPSVGRHTPI